MESCPRLTVACDYSFTDSEWYIHYQTYFIYYYASDKKCFLRSIRFLYIE